MIDEEDIKLRVKKGANILDEFYESPDWVKRMNLQQLDMAHCGRCVLGQLFGGFGNGEFILGREFSELGDDWDEELGFEHTASSQEFDTPTDYHRVVDAEYKALADAWVVEIRDRQERV